MTTLRSRSQQGRSALCFTVTGGGDTTVKVAGTSGPDIARGLGTYLRSELGYSFAWNRTGGNSIPTPLELPRVWPVVAGEVGRGVTFTLPRPAPAPSPAVCHASFPRPHIWPRWE